MLGFQGRITRLRSSSGAPYLGVSDIPPTFVQKYLSALNVKIGDSEFSKAQKNQQIRDRFSYHITVVSPDECKVLGYREASKKVLGRVVRIDFGGIGKTSENRGNTTYYAIVESRDLDQIRTMFELRTRDFHVTLGFLQSDIHNVSKSTTSQFISEQTVFLTPRIKRSISRTEHAA
jgi:hypothetical protein